MIEKNLSWVKQVTDWSECVSCGETIFLSMFVLCYKKKTGEIIKSNIKICESCYQLNK